MRNWNVRLWVAMLLLLTTLACVLLAPEESTVTPTDEETGPEADVTLTATADLTLTATATPDVDDEDDTGSRADTPTATPEGCTLDARFVEDVTIPDDSVLDPGTEFRKTWRLRNTGNCDWEPGTQLVFTGNNPMGSGASVTVPATSPGTVTDVSVDFTAPTLPGTYRSEWRLQAPDGTRFGPTVYVKIVIPSTETPTLTDTPTPITPTPSPTADGDGAGCSIPYDPAFAATMDYADDLGFDVGCPEGAAYEVSGAAQVFWANVDEPNPHLHYRTLMIWNTPYKQGEIYYVTVSETNPVQPFHAAYDTWEESMPEVPPACEDMTVPDGYIMPIRGFGKLWCDRELWTTIGWPRGPETGLNFLVQHTEDGRLMRLGDPLINTFVVAWDYDSNEALVQMNPIEP